MTKIANPQIEDGFFKIANELAEALATAYLTPTESQTLWAFLRKTYGFNKKSDKISITQFQQLTRLSRKSQVKALKGLVTKRLLVVTKRELVNEYSIHKNYFDWGGNRPVTPSNQAGTTLVTKREPKLVTKREHTIDNKYNIQNTIQISTKSAGNEVNDFIRFFGGINPSYETLFKRKNQRDAAERLINKYGLEKLQQIIQALASAQNDRFCPVVTTPMQLEDKLGAVVSYFSKNKQKGKSYD